MIATSPNARKSEMRMKSLLNMAFKKSRVGADIRKLKNPHCYTIHVLKKEIKRVRQKFHSGVYFILAINWNVILMWIRIIRLSNFVRMFLQNLLIWEVLKLSTLQYF